LGEYLEEFDKTCDSTHKEPITLESKSNAKKEKKKVKPKIKDEKEDTEKSFSQEKYPKIKSKDIRIEEKKMIDLTNEIVEHKEKYSGMGIICPIKDTKYPVPLSPIRPSNLPLNSKSKVIQTKNVNIINNISNKTNEKKNNSRYGKIETDEPEEILDAKSTNDKNVKLLISWKKKSSEHLLPSYISINELENSHPELIHEYYRRSFYQLLKIKKLTDQPI